MITMFSTLLALAASTGMVQYDYSDHQRVVATTQIAQETLNHSCIPMYNEASMTGSFVKIPHYCGLEITHNTMSQTITMKETYFDIVLEKETMSFVRTNHETKTK